MASQLQKGVVDMTNVAGFYIIEEALFTSGEPEPSYVEWVEFHDTDDPPFQGRIELNGGDYLVYRVLAGPFPEIARARGWLADYDQSLEY